MAASVRASGKLKKENPLMLLEVNSADVLPGHSAKCTTMRNTALFHYIEKDILSLANLFNPEDFFKHPEQTQQFVGWLSNGNYWKHSEENQAISTDLMPSSQIDE